VTDRVISTLEFPYRRSLGPVAGAFFTGLRDGRLLATRTRDGRVLSPPLEYDPESGEPVADGLVEVGPAGEVTAWAWVSHPGPRHPLSRPFAFALIRPDGASTALVHVVDAGDAANMHTGMRVVPRWKAEREGRITDIEAFVPSEARS
jgi:uncharacterized OB-fold protein